VEYKYRMGDWEGVSAIDLSRKNMRVSNERDSLNELKKNKMDSLIVDWMQKPCVNESLPKMLMETLE
jgi:hypothetical protein